MKLKEIVVVDKETNELIARLPFGMNDNEIILKKGFDIKVSYDKPFEIENVDGKLVLKEEETPKVGE